MKRFLTSLFAFAGLANAAPPQPTVQTLDPKSILFTTPTLSNDIAPLEPVTHKRSKADFIFHEDEWCQVEFFTKDRLADVQRLLKEYKPYEQAHRTQYGWREVYVRKIQRTPIVSGGLPIQQLERLLGAKAGSAPMLFSSDTISGKSRTAFPCR